MGWELLNKVQFNMQNIIRQTLCLVSLWADLCTQIGLDNVYYNVILYQILSEDMLEVAHKKSQ